MEKTKRAALVILDGFGLSNNENGNAISIANTPNWDLLNQNCNGTTLLASGLDVGLPDGQMGNSEVGHMNIGAGRVVFQNNPLITKAIEDGDFFRNPIYLNAIDSAVRNDKAVHILGLLSDGGVHSLISQIFAMIKMVNEHSVKRTYIHCFLDGRDVSPTSGASFVSMLLDFIKDKPNTKIASIQGRFWGMDRDKRWDRLQKGYDAIVKGQGQTGESPVEDIKRSYENGVTDEFFEPTVYFADGHIKDGDSVIFMNFRPDRAREMTWAITGNLPAEAKNFCREELNVNYVCTTSYDEALGLPIAFPPFSIKDTLGEVISRHKIRQFRIAETEKYAHVTFFFNGGTETEYEGETRVLIPSPREFATYDLIPQMSAELVCNELVEAMSDSSYGFYVCNFANCDMVGHTGVLPAAVKAVETVDLCLGRIIKAAEENNIILFITADHGNAEKMFGDDGSPNTAHTTNPVPFIICGTDKKFSSSGRLADIAPTILTAMGIEKPEIMTGKSLI